MSPLNQARRDRPDLDWTPSGWQRADLRARVPGRKHNGWVLRSTPLGEWLLTENLETKGFYASLEAALEAVPRADQPDSEPTWEEDWGNERE